MKASLNILIWSLLLISILFGNAYCEDIEDKFFEAREARLSGRLDESIELYRALLARRPGHEWGRYGLAQALRAVGDLQGAGRALDDLLRVGGTGLLAADPPSLLQVLNDRAMVARDLGDPTLAIDFYRQAIEIEVDDKHSNYNLAVLLSSKVHDGHLGEGRAAAARGAAEQSLGHFQAALRGADRDQSGVSIPMILNDYALALAKAGRDADALAALLRALELDPESFQTHGNLALQYQEAGDPARALAHAERAAAAAPASAAARHNLGRLLQDAGREDDALGAFEEAVALAPDQWVSLASVAHIRGKRGELAEARELYARARAAAATAGNRGEADALRLMEATAVVPHIYESVDHILASRAALGANLKALLGRGGEEGAAVGSPPPPLLIPSPETSVGCGALGYYVIYQGFDDRELRQDMARIYWQASPSLRYEAPFLAALPGRGAGPLDLEEGEDAGRKLRVGFVSKFFFRHSVGLLTEGVICNLDRARFEVTAIFLEPQPADEVSSRIRSCVDRAVSGGTSVASAQAAVAALELDVLVFTEIGMDSQTYFLAFAHLARRTALFWGHAITSGIAASDAIALAGLGDPREVGGVDYFVSSVLFEAEGPGAQRKYAERLYLMDGLTTAFRPPLAPREGMRPGDLGLPPLEGRNLYLCPQTLYKLHPDFDKVLLRLLDADPKALVAMPEAQQGAWTASLARRMGAALGARRLRRVAFVRRMAFDEFQAAAAMANVIIDPFPLGGGRSTLEILSTGTPIVMWYERTSILQLTYGMYETMDASGQLTKALVAHSEDEFVTKLLEIGTNRDREGELRARILARCHLLYDREDVVREWETFLRFIVSVPRPLDAPGETRALVANEIHHEFSEESSQSSSVKHQEEIEQEMTVIEGEDLTFILEDTRPPGGGGGPGPGPGQRWERRPWGWEAAVPAAAAADDDDPGAPQPDTTGSGMYYAIRLVFPNPYTKQTNTYILEVPEQQEDWVGEMIMDFGEHAGLDHTQKRWLHRILRRGALAAIDTSPVIYRRHLAVAGPDGVVARTAVLEVREGTDLFQAAGWAAYRLGFEDGEAAAMIHGLLLEALGEGWEARPRAVALRRALDPPGALPPGLRWKWPPPSEEGGGAFSGMAVPIEEIARRRWRRRDCVTLGITASRRRGLLERSLAALVRGGGGAALPDFGEGGFICKVIIIDDASSPEDRKAMVQQYPGFEFILKDPSSRGHANSLNKLLRQVDTRWFLYMEDDWEYVWAPATDGGGGGGKGGGGGGGAGGWAPLRAAVAALNGSLGTEEPLAQVILNDQSCRDRAGAVATDGADPRRRCPHRSGWPRTISNIQVLLHEFGVLKPTHDIAYWPGFSLNPAIWDFEVFKAEMDNSIGNMLFNESDRLFESWASMQVEDAGMNVAFLDDITFRHIGTQESAYSLNDLKRPWDDL